MPERRSTSVMGEAGLFLQDTKTERDKTPARCGDCELGGSLWSGRCGQAVVAPSVVALCCGRAVVIAVPRDVASYEASPSIHTKCGRCGITRNRYRAGLRPRSRQALSALYNVGAVRTARDGVGVSDCAGAGGAARGVGSGAESGRGADRCVAAVWGGERDKAHPSKNIVVKNP